MGKKFKVGLVGAGWPCWQHIKGYKKYAGVEVRALCDADQEKLMRTAEEYDVPQRYLSFEEMLNKEELDAVSVCTPNFLHAPMAIAAMRRGLHVLCEKPMASTVDMAKEMARVQKETGVVLMISHQRRFTPQSQYLKNIIRKGELGEIYYVRGTWVRRQGIPGMGGWFTQKEKSGGGALIDIGVHVLDLSMWLMDHPDPLCVQSIVGSKFGVHGKGASGYAVDTGIQKKSFDVDDYVFSQINFKNGCAMQLQCSWAGHIKQEEFNIEIWGTQGGARLNPFEIYSEQNGVIVDITPKFPEINSFDIELRAFLDSAINGVAAPSTPDQGVKTMEIIDMIYRSGETGQSISAIETRKETEAALI
jgi:predicted dehydrogenase